METDRLILRELVSDDLPALSEVLCDPETMQYYPSPFDQKQVERWIAWNMESYRKYHHGLWALILKKEGVCIGDCGITMQRIERDLVPEIGFHVLKRYWNRGYATEAAIACRDYAFDVLCYPKVFSYSTLENLPSQRVAEKMGMQVCRVFEKNGEKHILQAACQPEQEKAAS